MARSACLNFLVIFFDGLLFFIHMLISEWSGVIRAAPCASIRPTTVGRMEGDYLTGKAYGFGTPKDSGE